MRSKAIPECPIRQHTKDDGLRRWKKCHFWPPYFSAAWVLVPQKKKFLKLQHETRRKSRGAKENMCGLLRLYYVCEYVYWTNSKFSKMLVVLLSGASFIIVLKLGHYQYHTCSCNHVIRSSFKIIDIWFFSQFVLLQWSLSIFSGKKGADTVCT